MVHNAALRLLARASLISWSRLFCQASAQPAAKSGEVVERIEEAGEVFSEIMAAPDKAIPEEILGRAHCIGIGIAPGMKRAGFVVGGSYGKGVLTCRSNRSCSGPSTIRIEGGSFGAQIGGGETDVVLVLLKGRNG
jgi:lipid-binding SYLF domain-containing protein